MKRMEKAACLVLACVLAAAVFGCASKSASGANPPRDLPDFVLNPPDNEDVIYGIGGAKMATAQYSLQNAENRARVSIAQTIGATVRNRMVDLQQGSEDDPVLQQFQQSISETLTKAELSGTKVVKREVAPDGTYWVLMSLPADEAKRAAIKALGQNPNKKLADQAIADMDAAFEKLEKSEAVSQ
jgi:hypothetical protein